MIKTKKDKVVTQSYLNKTVKNIERKILESEERIMGELKSIREEHEVYQFSHQRINDELQEHDDRLRKLEQPAI